MARKPTEAVTEKLTQEASIGINEIGEDRVIEQASENDIAMEAFMDDELTIHVSESREEGAYTVITPSVNAVNQPIIRGRQQKVKRKYVEALARSRITEYEQLVQDPSKPENIQMVPRSSVTYPFAVIHDPHPNGAEWLNQILAQP